MSSPFPRWLLPATVLELSYRELATDGASYREGIAFWAGRSVCTDDNADEARVTHIVLLRGDGVSRGPGYISIAPELLNDVTDTLAAVDDETYLIGQIHGHPPDASTDLSWVDIAYGIRTPGFLSVVAPDFGMRPVPLLTECGVHVFEPLSGWRRMLPREVDARVRLIHDAAHEPTVLTVGAE